MSTDGKMDEEKKKEIIHSFEQQGFRKNNLATDNDFQVKTISYLGEHCGAEHHFKKDEDFSGDPEKDEWRTLQPNSPVNNTNESYLCCN